MLIGLFTLLFAVVLGGEETPFILPKAEKTVKQILVDSDNKKEILGQMKVFTKSWKKLEKTKKKQAKAIAKLNKDYSVDQQLIADAFSIYRKEREPIVSEMTQLRLSVQEKFTKDEWDQFMDRIISVSPKQSKKLDKANAKAVVKQDKQLAAIASEIENAFTDPAKIESAKQFLLAFEDAMARLLVENQDYLSSLVEVMEDQNATKDELTSIVNHQEKIRAGAHESFLAFRKNLVELSSEEDWPKLSKTLGKLIK